MSSWGNEPSCCSPVFPCERLPRPLQQASRSVTARFFEFERTPGSSMSLMDAVMACWPQAASKEPRAPKKPLAITILVREALAEASHQTFGHEWDAARTPPSSPSASRPRSNAEADVGTWYACSPDKASGLQAASRAMHGMLELPREMRPSCTSPTAGHALDVQRSWLSRQLNGTCSSPKVAEAHAMLNLRPRPFLCAQP